MEERGDTIREGECRGAEQQELGEGENEKKGHNAK